MVALDQNSSMIEMAAKALKAKGQDREPTYEEIVEAKVDLARHLAPSASGVLIDAYYGAWSCVAAGAIGPQTGLLVRVEMSGSPKNKVGAPAGPDRAGLERREDQAHGGRRRQAAGPVRAHRAALRRAPVPVDRACLRRMQEARHPDAARDRGVSVRRRKENRSQLSSTGKPRPSSTRPASSAGSATFTRPSSPATLGHDSDKQLRDNLQALNAASERPWVLLSAGVDYPDYYKQVQMAMEAGASGVLGGRAFWKEYFLQDGAQARSQFAATTALKRVADVNTLVRERRHPLVCPIRLHQGDADARSGPLKAGMPAMARASGSSGGARHPQKERRAKFTEPSSCRTGHIRKPPLGKDADAHGAGTARPCRSPRSRAPAASPERVLFGKELNRAQPRPDSFM